MPHVASTHTPALIVVVPVFEDAHASSMLLQQLHSAFGDTVHVVAVEDGSVRDPLTLAHLSAAGVSGCVIHLRRNVGHQRAIAIGLSHVAQSIGEAQCVVVMDADGEDRPQSISELLSGLNGNDIDIVVAERKARVETLRFKLFYAVYKWMFKLLTGRTISFGNFMAMTPAALKRLTSMQELWLHVASCALSSRLRIATCAIDRGPRYAGQSKMNFVGLALHGFRGVMVFAEDVLVRVGIAAALIGSLTVLLGAVSVALKVSGLTTPGWFSVALGILLIVFLQIGCLALMSLMLTGIARPGAVLPSNYTHFVDRLECR